MNLFFSLCWLSALGCTDGLTTPPLPVVAQPADGQSNQIDDEISWEAGLPDRQEFQAVPVAETQNENFWQ